MNKIIDRFLREPVFGFAAAQLWVFAVWPDMSDAKRLAVGGTCAWLQRTFSTSKRTADEGTEVAKYVGAVEHQATALAAQVAVAAPAPPAAPEAAQGTRERPVRARKAAG